MEAHVKPVAVRTMTPRVLSTAFAVSFIILTTGALVRSIASRREDVRLMTAGAVALIIAEDTLVRDALLARMTLRSTGSTLTKDMDEVRSASRRIATDVGRSFPDFRNRIGVGEPMGQALALFESEISTVQAGFAELDGLQSEMEKPGVGPASKAAIGSISSACASLFRESGAANLAILKDRLASAAHSTSRDEAWVPRLLRAGAMLADAIPASDSALSRLQDRTSRLAIERLLVAIRERRAAIVGRGIVVDAGLYTASMLALALLLRILASLRKDREELEWTLKKERLAFETSGLFIASPSEQIDGQLEAMMRMLREGYRSERVYLLLLDGSRRVVAWSGSGQKGAWPARLFDFVPEITAFPADAVRVPYDGLAISAGLRAALSENGVTSWSCVRVRDERGGLLAILGFDRSRPIPAGARSNHNNLLLHADTVHHALSRQRLSSKRAELQANLRRAERLEAIGTFTTGVAHNFNNLFAAMSGQAEMAMQCLLASQEAAHHLDSLLRTSARAQRVASQILEFGRFGGGRKQNFNVVDLLDETIRSVAAMPEARTTKIQFGKQAAPILVRADPEQMQQIFHNVILNAVQASPADSVVSVSADEREEPCGDGSPLSLRPGRYCIVRVSDIGIGMDDGTLARIFEPFFTTRPNGTGLGLATASEALREMEGEISVASMVGEGTTMSMWLPSASNNDEEQHAARTGPTVMMINPDTRALLRDEEILAVLGFEPVGFADWAGALETLAREGTRFDLVVAERTADAPLHDLFRVWSGASRDRQRIVLSGARSQLDATSLGNLNVHRRLIRPWQPALIASTLREAASAF